MKIAKKMTALYAQTQQKAPENVEFQAQYIKYLAKNVWKKA